MVVAPQREVTGGHAAPTTAPAAGAAASEAPLADAGPAVAAGDDAALPAVPVDGPMESADAMPPPDPTQPSADGSIPPTMPDAARDQLVQLLRAAQFARNERAILGLVTLLVADAGIVVVTTQ